MPKSSAGSIYIYIYLFISKVFIRILGESFEIQFFGNILYRY